MSSFLPKSITVEGKGKEGKINVCVGWEGAEPNLSKTVPMSVPCFVCRRRQRTGSMLGEEEVCPTRHTLPGMQHV